MNRSSDVVRITPVSSMGRPHSLVWLLWGRLAAARGAGEGSDDEPLDHSTHYYNHSADRSLLSGCCGLLAAACAAGEGSATGPLSSMSIGVLSP